MFSQANEGFDGEPGKGREMSAFAIEHSIHIHFEDIEGMGAADRDIELDYIRRSAGFIFEREACEGWWLWR